MNFLAGERRGDGSWSGAGGLALAAEGGSSGGRAAPDDARRPAARRRDRGDGRRATCDARVDVIEPRGSELLVHVRLGEDGQGQEVRVVAPPEQPLAVDTVVGLRCDRQRLHWFDSTTGRRIG